MSPWQARSVTSVENKPSRTLTSRLGDSSLEVLAPKGNVFGCLEHFEEEEEITSGDVSIDEGEVPSPEMSDAEQGSVVDEEVNFSLYFLSGS